MIRGAAAAAGAVVAWLGVARGAELAAPSHFDDARKWGRPVRVVPPEYPALERQRGIEGQVDVEGRITPTGTLRDVRLGAGAQDQEPFVRAVEKVLKWWEFAPAIGDDCLPKETPTHTRVWFEIVKGEPKVLVASAGPPAEPPPRSMEVVSRARPEYPRELAQRGLQAVVYTRSEVDASGKPLAVHGTAYSSQGSTTLERFRSEAERALMRWTYTPAPDGASGPRIACATVEFRLDPAK